jgi:hypothetical protein
MTANFHPGRCFLFPGATCLLAALLTARTAAGSVSSQDFGSSPLGTPATVSITISGVASTSLSLRYSVDYSIGACTPSGNSCSVPVTFRPVKTGLRQDAVIVTDSSGNVAQEVFLYGIGLGPLPVFSPALATYRAQAQGSDSLSGVQGMVGEPNGKMLLAAALTIYEFDPAAGSLTQIAQIASGIGPAEYGLSIDAAGIFSI